MRPGETMQLFTGSSLAFCHIFTSEAQVLFGLGEDWISPHVPLLGPLLKNAYLVGNFRVSNFGGETNWLAVDIRRLCLPKLFVLARSFVCHKICFPFCMIGTMNWIRGLWACLSEDPFKCLSICNRTPLRKELKSCCCLRFNFKYELQGCHSQLQERNSEVIYLNVFFRYQSRIPK